MCEAEQGAVVEGALLDVAQRRALEADPVLDLVRGLPQHDRVAAVGDDLPARPEQDVRVGPLGGTQLPPVRRGDVLGDRDEVEARLPGEVDHGLARRTVGVRVVGVQMEVAGVPVGLCLDDGFGVDGVPLGRCPLVGVGAGDGDLVRQAAGGDEAGAELDVPRARLDRAGDVAPLGLGGGDEHRVLALGGQPLAAPRPATERLWARGAVGVPDPEVQHRPGVALGAGLDVGPLVAHLDPGGALGDVHRQQRVRLGGALGQLALEHDGVTAGGAGRRFALRSGGAHGPERRGGEEQDRGKPDRRAPRRHAPSLAPFLAPAPARAGGAPAKGREERGRPGLDPTVRAGHVPRRRTRGNSPRIPGAIASRMIGPVDPTTERETSPRHDLERRHGTGPASPRPALRASETSPPQRVKWR